MPKRIPMHKEKGDAQRKREASALQRTRPESKWYASARWKHLRGVILARDPYCVRCKQDGMVTPADTVNHRVPHKSNYERFWDELNLEGVCKPCHSGKIQREERAEQAKRQTPNFVVKPKL